MVRVSVAVLVAGLAVLQDPAGTKLTWKAPAAGDRQQIRVESSIELDIETIDGSDKSTTSRQLAISRIDEFVQETAAAEGGRKDKVTCVSSKIQKSGTDRALKTEAGDIQGLVFTVETSDKGRTVRLADGNPAPIDAAGIGTWEDAGKLLPTGEAKEGAVWNVDASSLAGLISIVEPGASTGIFEAKLEKVVEGKARITFTGAVTGKTAKGGTYKLNITGGSLEFDVTKGRASLLVISGSAEVTHDIVQKVPRPGDINKSDEKVATVNVKTRKLEAKVEYK